MSVEMEAGVGGEGMWRATALQQAMLLGGAVANEGL